MSHPPSRTLLLATVALAVGLTAPAFAQQKPGDLPQPALPDPAASEIINNKNIERRLEREEKALRDMRQIVLQSKAQGNPVTVKDAGPDPEVEALKARISDLEETLRRLTGQMEEVAHNAQLAAKAAADAGEANKVLAGRVDRIEQPLLAAGAAALAAQQAQAQAQSQLQASNHAVRNLPGDPGQQACHGQQHHPCANGQPAALPAPSQIDISRIDGQVRDNSIKKVGEVVSSHPEEALAIIRTWLHQPV